jgi:hypothetical protein
MGNTNATAIRDGPADVLSNISFVPLGEALTGQQVALQHPSVCAHRLDRRTKKLFSFQ